MYSKLGTVIAIIAAIFPFAVVIASLAQTESAITAIVVAAISAVFFLTILIASRITVEPDLETAAVPHEPAKPIEWNWDGINRQPSEGEGEGAESKAQH
ncbi:MAG TPA: hypothetical protein VFU22_11305 [Roseiflexaceae bacterium]|nr:hypothetical protein [Roseiflexaceae bacterium]